MSADGGDYIAITVAPAPDPDADDLTRPIDLVGKTLRAVLDLITEAGPESALDAAELEQVGRDLDEIVDRVYLPRDKRERQRGSLMIHAGSTFYLDAPTQHVIAIDDEERDVCFRAEWELFTDDPTAAADEQAVGYFCALAARGHDVDFAGVAEQRYRIGDDLYRVHIDTHDWEMTVYRHSAGADGKPTEPGVEVETVSL